MPYKDPKGSGKEPKKNDGTKPHRNTMSRVANASKLREGQKEDEKYANGRKAVIGATVAGGVLAVGAVAALTSHCSKSKPQAQSHSNSDSSNVHWTDKDAASSDKVKHSKKAKKDSLDKNIDDILNAGKEADSSKSKSKVSKSINEILGNKSEEKGKQNNALAAVIGPASGKSETDGIPAGVKAQLNNSKSVLAMANVDTGNYSNGTHDNANKGVKDVNPDMSALYRAMTNAPEAPKATDFLSPNYKGSTTPNYGSNNYLPNDIPHTSGQHFYSPTESAPKPVTPSTINPMPTNPFASSSNGTPGKLETPTSEPAVITKPVSNGTTAPTSGVIAPSSETRPTSETKPVGSTVIEPTGNGSVNHSQAVNNPSSVSHAPVSASSSNHAQSGTNNNSQNVSASISASLSQSISASQSASISASISASLSASVSASLAGEKPNESASIAQSMSASMSQSASFSNGAQSASASQSTSQSMNSNSASNTSNSSSKPSSQGSNSLSKPNSNSTSNSNNSNSSSMNTSANNSSTQPNKPSSTSNNKPAASGSTTNNVNGSNSLNKPTQGSTSNKVVQPTTSQGTTGNKGNQSISANVPQSKPVTNTSGAAGSNTTVSQTPNNQPASNTVKVTQPTNQTVKPTTNTGNTAVSHSQPTTVQTAAPSKPTSTQVRAAVMSHLVQQAAQSVNTQVTPQTQSNVQRVQ